MKMIVLTDAGSQPGEPLILNADHFVGCHVALDNDKKKVTMVRMNDDSNSYYFVKESPIEIGNILSALSV